MIFRPVALLFDRSYSWRVRRLSRQVLPKRCVYTIHRALSLQAAIEGSTQRYLCDFPPNLPRPTDGLLLLVLGFIASPVYSLTRRLLSTRLPAPPSLLAYAHALLLALTQLAPTYSGHLTYCNQEDDLMVERV